MVLSLCKIYCIYLLKLKCHDGHFNFFFFVTERYQECCCSRLPASVSLFCVWAPELSTLCLGTASSSAFVTLSSLPHGWAVTRASLQPPRATNSHPGPLVILGMYFGTLGALCPSLKFSRTPTGHRSTHQTEAADKNSDWCTGHLKIARSCPFSFKSTSGRLGTFDILSRCHQKTGAGGRFVHREGGSMMGTSFYSYVTSYCWENVRVQEKDCVDIRFSGPLRGPHALTNRAVCPLSLPRKNSTSAVSEAEFFKQCGTNWKKKGLKLVSFVIFRIFQSKELW